MRALALALCAVACRVRHGGAASPSDDRPPPARDVSRAVEAPAPASPAPVPAAWCWRARPRADVRAIDARGAVWSVRAGRVTDESRGVIEALPGEIPCQQRGAWAMEFARGAAFLVADSRLYVRAPGAAGFAVTPLCSDVTGAPWSQRAAGGWSFVSHRGAPVEPTLMLTRAPAGDTGWFAVTGLDDTTRAAVLDASDSFVALSGGGHLVFVDRVNTVAGAVFAAQDERFDGLTRTAAGIVAWRDDPHGARALVFAESAAGPFTRVDGRRPEGPPARAVLRVDLARFVAVTDASVELSTDRGARFERVLSVAADDGGDGSPLARPSVGWLAGQRLAVAAVGGVASESCAE